MYEIIRGMFISLTVGLIIFIFQTILNKRKEYFNALTYFKNVRPILYCNERVIDEIEKIYKFYIVDEQDRLINASTYKDIVKDNITYDLLINYFKTSHQELLLLPQLENGIINIKFYQFFFDNNDMSKNERLKILMEVDEKSRNLYSESQLTLGAYEALFYAIKSFNNKTKKLEGCLNHTHMINQKNEFENDDQIRKLLQDSFREFQFIKMQLNKFDEFIITQIRVTYNELNRFEKYHNYIKYILFALVLLFAIFLIA